MCWAIQVFGVHGPSVDLLRHIPLHPYFTEDIEMLEANMIIVHRSEFARRFFKW